MPRPRSAGKRRLPLGLYERNGYWSWRDPRTGKEWGIGRVDRGEAITQAMEALDSPVVTAERFPRRSGQRRELAILTHDEIAAVAAPLKEQCGIYFLVKTGQVMYVGQSINVGRRVAEHRITGRDFDAYHFVVVARELLDATEAAYILALNPVWNMNLPKNSE